jgi:hypothetical protein
LFDKELESFNKIVSFYAEDKGNCIRIRMYYKEFSTTFDVPKDCTDIKAEFLDSAFKSLKDEEEKYA